MQDKQKVTLYLPPELHRQLKIQAAVCSAPMSTLAEQAIEFFLSHQDVVREVEEGVNGRTHQVYICPECDSPLVLRDGEMISLRNQPKCIEDADGGSNFPSALGNVGSMDSSNGSQGEEALVPC